MPEAAGLELTRTFSGVYCEPPTSFGIKGNPLAPKTGRLIAPRARSTTPVYANGGNTFGLSRFDPAYFERLRAFVAEAGKRGIVVELVLFRPFYEDEMDELNLMEASNNVNGIGTMRRRYSEKLWMDMREVRRILPTCKRFIPKGIGRNAA